MTFCVLALAALPAFAAPHVPLYFEKNLGQADTRVRYLARTRQATIFLTDRETVFSLRGGGRKEAAVRMTLPGSRRAVWNANEPQPVSVSSYVGSPANWRKEIPTFAKITRQGVYPGVDLVYYGSAREMEYDFVLRPGADPGKIRLRFTGVKRPRISRTGDLELETQAGTLVHRKPRIFQYQDEVAGRYRLLPGGDVGIELTGRYDRSRPVRIDPVVTFASFYGGEADDVITSVSGQAIAGYTNSIAFPGTRAPAMGGYDAFVIAFGASTRFVYIGGSRDDKAWTVFHRESDPAVFLQRPVLAIAGETESPDFPVFLDAGALPAPPGSLASFAGGRTDGFLVTIAPDTRQVPNIQSVLVGGSGDDRILGLTADNGAVYGVGDTTSPNLTASGRQLRLSGGKDGLLVSRTLFASFASGAGTAVGYWGGSGDDSLRSISLASGMFAIAGTTTSDDMPLERPIQDSRRGGTEGYAAILPALFGIGPIVFGSYWGGSGDDAVHAVALRADRSLWIFGETGSADLRMEKASQASFGGGATDAFVAQFLVPLDSNLPAALARSSYLGGAEADTLAGVAVTTDFYLAGTTSSRNFPQRDPLQPAYGGGDSDAWVAQLSPGGELVFSSYYGGAGTDEGRGIGLDRAGGLLLAGTSTSRTIPGGEGGGSRGPGGGVHDGYAVQITTPVLSLETPALAAKDAMSVARLLPATLPLREVTLRARSSDPSRLTVSFGPTTEGAAEASTQWNGERRNVYVHGLATEGTAEITVAAEGLGERKFLITLAPFALSVVVSNPAYRAFGPLPFNPISPLKTGQAEEAFVTVGFVAAGADGTVTEAVMFPRAGLPPTSVSLQTADPGVASVRPAVLTLASPTDSLGGYGSDVILTAGRAGSTELTAGISGLTSRTFPITVEPIRARLTAVAVARMMGIVSLTFDVSQASHWGAADGELISEDPESALLARNGPGSASVILPNVFQTSTSVTLYSDEPGRIARIRSRIAGVEDGVVEVPVETPHFNANRALRVERGGRGVTQISFGRNLNGFLSQFRAAQPLRFRVSSLNPEIAVAEQEVITANAGDFGVLAGIRGMSQGEASFVVESLDGVAPMPGGDRFTVQVVTASPPQSLILITDGVVGKDLQSWAPVRVNGGGSAPVTVTSGDPSKLLLSASQTTAGSPSITLPPNRSDIYLQSIGADTGTVDVTLSAPGLPSAVQTIRLVPAMMILSRSGDFEIPLSAQPVNFGVSFVPVTGGYSIGVPEFSNQTTGEISAIPFQGLRPGATAPEFTVTNSNPAVGDLTQTGQLFRFAPVAPGLTEIELKTGGQPAGRGQKLRIRVSRAALVSSWFNYPLGRNIARPVRISSPGTSTRIRVTSSDPSKVLLNGLSELEAGTGEVFFVEGVSDSGSARVTAEAPGHAGTSFQVDLSPAVLVLDVGFRAPLRLESIIQPGSQPSIRARVTSLAPGLVATEDVLREGAPPVRFQVRSSNPAVAPSPGEFTITRDAVTIPLRALTPGTTIFEATAPEGHGGVAEARAVEARFRYPNLRLPDVLLFRNFQTFVRIETESGMLPPEVAITSSNPAIAGLTLGLQTNPSLPAGPPQPSIVLRDRQEFLIQSVGGEGDLTIEAKADNFTSVRAKVRVAPPTLGFVDNSPQTADLARREFGLSIGTFHSTEGLSPNAHVSSQYRPDAPPVSVRLESEDPSVAVADPEVISFPSANSFRVRLLKPGATTLRLIPPDGFRGDPARSAMQLSVRSTPMRLLIPGVLGKDLTTAGRIEANAPVLRYKVTSGDPSRLAVSSFSGDPGGASAEIPGINFYAHALADNGTVELLAEAEGYAPAVTEVRLGPSGVFLDVPSADLLAGSRPVQATVGLAALDPVNLNVVNRDLQIRPGHSIRVNVTSSDPRVLTVQDSPVLLNSITSRASVRVNPVGAGTATLAAEVPPGLTKPRTGSEATLTVKSPGFDMQPVVAGAWLEGPLVIRTNTEAPAGGLSVRVASDNPSVTFSVNPMTVTIPAGQRSATIRVAARAESGTANLSLTAPGYETGTVRLTIVPSGLVFLNSQVTIRAGQRQNGVIAPSPLEPATLRPIGSGGADYFVVAGAPNLDLTLTSANPAIAKPAAESLRFPAGPTSLLVAIDGVAAGETSIQINPPAPFRRASSGGALIVYVQ